MRPDDLPLLRTASTPCLSPDGTAVVFVVSTPDPSTDAYPSLLWTAPTDGSAPPSVLTRGVRDTSPVWSPDGRWIAFLRAAAKGPAQLFLVEAGGGEPVCLTDAPLGVSDPRFSPDSARIAVTARMPEPGRYVRDGEPAAEAPRLLTSPDHRSDGIGVTSDRPRRVQVVPVPESLDRSDPPSALPTPLTLAVEGDLYGQRWMPDGRALVAVAQLAVGDLRRDAVLLPVDDSPATPLRITDAEQGSTLAVETILPSRDGATLWMLAGDLGADGKDFVAALTGLYSVDLLTAGATPVRHTDPERVDLVPGVLAQTDDEVLVAEQRRGDVVLLGVPARGTQAPRVLVDHPAVVSSVSVGAGTVAVSAGLPDSAGEILVVDLAGGEPRSVTAVGAGLREAGRFREPVEITGTAPDGYPVHGWAVLPDPVRYGPGPHPTILMIHGGPFAQYTTALFDEVQVLAEAGYVVVYGNPRGSSGYGSAHGRAIRRAMGTVDADDVLALLDAASARLPIDPARLGVMGGSYGGYLSAWLTTRTDRFTAAIVERGFLDPVSFVGSSDIGWFFGLEYVGAGDGPEDAAAIAAQSPMAHVARVRTPTLVVHSEQDWRCPVEQGQRWFVELYRRGVPTELLLFPGEGHELTRSGRPQHRVARFEHVLRWWDRYLPVGGSA
ncbi:prolyl oligopeptidase family serine peptidase [Actinotalea sp.]|uniref:S9 family peptidase n=1 Tax=Actinotalea sp. TaxID=1872145 RepID=UPI0035628AD6